MRLERLRVFGSGAVGVCVTYVYLMDLDRTEKEDYIIAWDILQIVVQKSNLRAQTFPSLVKS